MKIDRYISIFSLNIYIILHSLHVSDLVKNRSLFPSYSKKDRKPHIRFVIPDLELITVVETEEDFSYKESDRKVEQN